MTREEFETILCPGDDAYLEMINKVVPYYTIKQSIIANFNPIKIVEIGVRAGYSAWAFLKMCPKAEYIGIDADNNTYGGEDGPWIWWAHKILKDFNYKIDEYDIQKVKWIEPATFYHIDGDHSYEGVRHSLGLCYQSLMINGVILVDDDYQDSVRDGILSWVKDKPVLTKHIESFRGELLICNSNSVPQAWYTLMGKKISIKNKLNNMRKD